MKQVIRIATAGSVDDGKSTLIGRLLYETKSLKEDQLQHIEEKSRIENKGYIDFSLATDGLLTERKQGITIDVSHIYLQTKTQRYIIADSPGHVEYTRNMVTGASTAHAAIILLDAQKGVSEQTIRHFRITSLLGIPQLIFAINKMDLIGFSQSKFHQIQKDILALNKASNGLRQELFFIPISALHGDNVVSKSVHLPWHDGTVLIDLIEQLKIDEPSTNDAVLNVQYVLRSKNNSGAFQRGYAGKVACGKFIQNASVVVSPSNNHSTIIKIEHHGDEVQEAKESENITLYLRDQLDISRGSVIVSNPHSLQRTNRLKATVCWMETDALTLGNKYWLQHGVNRILCKVVSVEGKMNLISGGIENVNTLHINDLGQVQFQLAQELLVKPFSENKALGSFILINYLTNNTAGVGFIN
ncbi:MAG: GTP-binding protein [Flavobacteriaceae bacterium]|nr:GTP-binding protein [Flavobacteriaceae bacterium]MCY4217046.1 GTP-binding protein [Flavobacteriaceae bacterium]MCY4253655.1 GTP-binding protein [Flavobacteriaceae bacterium]